MKDDTTTQAPIQCRAIFTKYLGPTNHRGSMVKAYDQEGHSVTLDYNCAYHTDDIHYQAALALLAKMGWRGPIRGGWTKEGSVWVFVPEGGE